MAVQPHLDKVHRERELVQGQKAVLVNVGKRPNLVEDVRRQLALYQLGLCLLARDPALRVGPTGHEVRSVLLHVWSQQPLVLVDGSLSVASHLHHGERGRLCTDLAQFGQIHALRLHGDHLKELWHLDGEHVLQLVHFSLVDLFERLEIQRQQLLPHHGRVGEVSERHALLLGNLLVDLRQVCDELLLHLLLAHEGRHLLFQVVYQVGVHLRQPRSLDQVVELAHGGAAGQLRERGVEVVLLRFEQPSHVVVHQGFVPEGTDVHAGDLGGVDDLAEVPHHGAVDAHQLGGRAAVRLVQDDVDLVIVALHGQNHAPELVRDIQLGYVEEHQDHVHAVSEPPHDGLELVAALDALLLPSQHSGRVDQRDAFEART
mmetsp:Transcript_44003/g.125987  ORF Transcript_44003/g.125987 Transcript_44003/m.125987 type:complete len:373 (+) Transcript_44003:275-1393(+)